MSGPRLSGLNSFLSTSQGEEVARRRGLSKQSRKSAHSITQQRAALQLTTPTRAEKEYRWSQVDLPSAGIYADEGGYTPSRRVQQAPHYPARCVFVAGGVRGGKSLGSAMEYVPWTPRSRLIWLA